jgi:hypothetical protein
MSLKAQDQRGNAAALLYGGSNELSICLVTRDSAGDVIAAAAGFTHVASDPGTLEIDTTMAMPESGQNPGLMLVAGRVSTAAARVEIQREDGVDVHATVASGYFLAWWPTEAKAVQVVALDKAGSELARIQP